MKLIFAALTFALSPLSLPALAQFSGPGAHIKTDLAVILANPVDDDYVRLRGYLVEKVSSDKYIFTDGKQQIRVEIDQDVFPLQPLGDKDLIEIEGEVEKDFMQSPEIDVKRLLLIENR